MKTKKVIVIGSGVVIVGAVAYYLLSNKKESQTESQTDTGTTANKNVSTQKKTRGVLDIIMPNIIMPNFSFVRPSTKTGQEIVSEMLENSSTYTEIIRNMNGARLGQPTVSKMQAHAMKLRAYYDMAQKGNFTFERWIRFFTRVLERDRLELKNIYNELYQNQFDAHLRNALSNYTGERASLFRQLLTDIKSVPCNINEQDRMFGSQDSEFGSCTIYDNGDIGKAGKSYVPRTQGDASMNLTNQEHWLRRLQTENY